MWPNRLLASALVLAVTGCAADSVGPSDAAPRPLASRATPTILHFLEPVSFTIPEGTCGLATTVTGTGELRAIVQFTRRPDGRYNPAPINVTAHGTAVGEDGSRYVFSYMNNGIVRDQTGGFSLPFTVSVVDKFALVGGGSAPDVRVFQRLTLRFNADGTVTVLQAEVRGDPACDAF